MNLFRAYGAAPAASMCIYPWCSCNALQFPYPNTSWGNTDHKVNVQASYTCILSGGHQMAIAVVAKLLKKNPNLPVLTCVNTLLMSSWAQSLILGHTEFKQMMMIVMLSFKIEDYHWYEPAHSLANHLSNKQFHSQTLSQEPSWGNCFWFVFCNQDPLSYSRFEKNGNRRSSQRSLSPNGASKRDCVDDAFMEIHGYSIELHSKK